MRCLSALEVDRVAGGLGEGVAAGQDVLTDGTQPRVSIRFFNNGTVLMREAIFNNGALSQATLDAASMMSSGVDQQGNRVPAGKPCECRILLLG